MIEMFTSAAEAEGLLSLQQVHIMQVRLDRGCCSGAATVEAVTGQCRLSRVLGQSRPCQQAMSGNPLQEVEASHTSKLIGSC